MQCQRRATLLVVLTLLQLCRAEIKDTQAQWYSANIINDGFQPKSISELFSTESPFSTANPIIVAPRNNIDDILLLSTMSPPTSLSSTTSEFGKTSTETYPSSSESTLSSFSPGQTSLPQYSSSQQMPFQQLRPRTTENQQSFQQVNQPSIEFRQQSILADFEQLQPMEPLLKMMSELQSQPQHNVQVQQDQSSTQTMPPNPPVIKLTTYYQPQPTETTQPQVIRFSFPQDTQSRIGPESSTSLPPQTMPPQSNYFLIYQQAPQSIQTYTEPTTSQTTVREEVFTTTDAPPVTSTFASTFSSLTPSFSTAGSIPMIMRSTPLFYSSTSSPTTNPLPSSSPPRVTVTSLSTIGSSSSIASSTSNTRMVNCMVPRSTTPISRLINRKPAPIPIDTLFPLKIRVLSPSGTITNINFLPTARTPVQAPQKYIAYTITRKPTPRRTPKPRKNTYERCLQGCRKNGQTLCAAPLAQFPVDPKTLRGFPSVCHMACHNSFRKDAYEKIIDGSCGKLRTRIRPIDSEYKLTRDELQKLQSIQDNSGEQAVLEFTGTYT